MTERQLKQKRVVRAGAEATFMQTKAHEHMARSEVCGETATRET